MFPPQRLKKALNLGGLSVKDLAIRTWKQIGENEIMTRASGISFYAMLAIVPILALVITIAVQLLPDLSGGADSEGMGQLTVEQFQDWLAEVVPSEANEVIREQIKRMQEAPPVGLLSIGLLLTLWSASSLFMAIMDAMNVIFGVTEARPFWKRRVTAIGMTVVQAVLLIGAFLTIVLWPQVLDAFGLRSTPGGFLATAVQLLIVFVMILISFALTLYIAPNAEQRWEWITPGSLLGTVLFLGASFLFRQYVQNFASYNETYGSLGGVMALLFWFWIACIVLLSSGQINKVIEDAAKAGKTNAG